MNIVSASGYCQQQPCVPETSCKRWHLHAVSRPATQLAGAVDVVLQLGGELRQVQEQVARGADHGHSASQLAARVDQVSGVHQAATLVTLVATSILWRGSTRGRWKTLADGSSTKDTTGRRGHGKASIALSYRWTSSYWPS